MEQDIPGVNMAEQRLRGFKVHELPAYVQVPPVRGRRDFYKIGLVNQTALMAKSIISPMTRRSASMNWPISSTRPPKPSTPNKLHWLIRLKV